MDLKAGEYSTQNYIDAQELERRGYVRETDQGRFFVWVDHNGALHNSPYAPEESLSETQVPNLQQDPKFSPFQSEERRTPLVTGALEQDAFAATLFGLDKPVGGILQQLSDVCCEQLADEYVDQLDAQGDGYVVEFERGRARHDFQLGESVYQVIALPESRQEYRVRLRSFIKKEMFYPTLVLLDSDYKPVRIVRHIVYDFHPENWHRFGYMEGWLKIEPQNGEAFLLVITIPDDLSRLSVVQRKSRDRHLTHGQRGMLQFTVMP
jgi:hypothetical protein